MSNLIQFPAKTTQTETVENYDLQWFLHNHYYDSDIEREFIQQALYNGMMDKYGEISTVEGHVARIESWLECLYWQDTDCETAEIFDPIREEMVRLQMWWEVQGDRMLKGEHYITEF